MLRFNVVQLQLNTSSTQQLKIIVSLMLIGLKQKLWPSENFESIKHYTCLKQNKMLFFLASFNSIIVTFIAAPKLNRKWYTLYYILCFFIRTKGRKESVRKSFWWFENLKRNLIHTVTKIQFFSMIQKIKCNKILILLQHSFTPSKPPRVKSICCQHLN